MFLCAGEIYNRTEITFFLSEKHRGLLASVAVEKYSCPNGVAKEKTEEGRSPSTPLEVDSGAASGEEYFLQTSATTTDSIRSVHRES